MVHVRGSWGQNVGEAKVGHGWVGCIAAGSCADESARGRWVRFNWEGMVKAIVGADMDGLGWFQCWAHCLFRKVPYMFIGKVSIRWSRIRVRSLE